MDYDRNCTKKQVMAIDGCKHPGDPAVMLERTGLCDGVPVVEETKSFL